MDAGGGDPYEQYNERRKKWYLDVRQTPCARSALIYGILGGLTVGGLWFAKSGVVRRSCDFAVCGFAVVSLVSWEVCRYVKAKQRAELKRTIHVLESMNKRKARDSDSSPPDSDSVSLQETSR